MWQLTDTNNLYLILAAISVVVFTMWVWRRLIAAERLRIDLVKRRKRFDSIITETPVKEPKKLAQSRALENIHQRFKTIRRIIFSLIFVIGVPLLVLPVLRGAPSVYISLFLGITTAVIGIAARPLIENAISGVVLSVGYPARIGDTVYIDGHYGTIERIGLTQSTIKIWDWRRYVIPNSKFLQKEYINLSWVDKFEWACVEFWIAADSDLEAVESIVVDAVKESPAFSDYEPPAFWVMEIAKDAIKCWVCGWTATPSLAWQLKSDVRKRLVIEFRERGIKLHSMQQNVSFTSSGAGHDNLPGSYPAANTELASPVDSGDSSSG